MIPLTLILLFGIILTSCTESPFDNRGSLDIDTPKFNLLTKSMRKTLYDINTPTPDCIDTPRIMEHIYLTCTPKSSSQAHEWEDCVAETKDTVTDMLQIFDSDNVTDRMMRLSLISEDSRGEIRNSHVNSFVDRDGDSQSCPYCISSNQAIEMLKKQLIQLSKENKDLQRQNRHLESQLIASRDENMKSINTAHELEMLILLHGKQEKSNASSNGHETFSFDEFERDEASQEEIAKWFDDMQSSNMQSSITSPIVQNCHKKLQEFRHNLQVDAEKEREKLQVTMTDERKHFMKEMDKEVSQCQEALHCERIESKKALLVEREKFQKAITYERRKFQKMLSWKHEEMEKRFAEEMEKSIRKMERDCQEALKEMNPNSEANNMLKSCLQQGFQNMRYAWVPKAGTILRKSSNFVRSTNKVEVDDNSRIISPENTPMMRSMIDNSGTISPAKTLRMRSTKNIELDRSKFIFPHSFISLNREY